MSPLRYEKGNLEVILTETPSGNLGFSVGTRDDETVTETPPSFAPTRRSVRPLTGGQPIRVAGGPNGSAAPVAVGVTRDTGFPGGGVAVAPPSVVPPRGANNVPLPSNPVPPAFPRQSVRAGRPAPVMRPAPRPGGQEAYVVAPGSTPPAHPPVAPAGRRPSPVPGSGSGQPVVVRGGGAVAEAGIIAPPSFAPVRAASRGFETHHFETPLGAAPRSGTETDGFVQYENNAVPEFKEMPIKRKKPKIGRIIVLSLVGILVISMLWPISLLMSGNRQIAHVDALSGAANTPGTTFLLVGTDERTEDGWQDETVGNRSDSIMLLHRPRNGTPALVSLPRDSYVQIPGYAPNKLNAAYALGGAPLLVQTVEQLTGLTIDHYVEIGMGGLVGLVDAVGGVELCYDRDVRDWRSAMYWTAGCHVVNGRKALAFSRMRYEDPTGDIGRTKRQRQVISAITHAALQPSLLWTPSQQRALMEAGLGALRTDEATSITDFVPLALAFRAANGADGFTGTPPISEYAYRPGGNVGATVRLDPELIDQFWSDLRTGNLEPDHPGN